MLQDPPADLALAAAGVPREKRRAVHDDRHARAAGLRLLPVGQHVEQEEELAVADPREPGREAAGRTPLVFGAYRLLVALPVLAVGRIGDQIVKELPSVAVVRQGAAEGNAIGIPARRLLDEQVGLRDRPRLGIHLLAEEMDIGAGVDRRSDEVAIPSHANRDVILRDREHPARAATGIVDGKDHAAPAEATLVAGQHQVHHQVHHVARREVLAGVLVEGLVELADQLLEDRPHRRVVDPVGVQVDVLEALQHLEEQPRLVELADGVVEVELLQHLAHVRAEPGDVVPQVRREVRRVGEELLEVVPRRVVEGEPRRLAKLAPRILELALELGLGLQDLDLGRGQHAVEPAENGERQDDVLVLAALEGVAHEVGDAPEEADDLAVVHAGLTSVFSNRRISPTIPHLAGRRHGADPSRRVQDGEEGSRMDKRQADEENLGRTRR